MSLYTWIATATLLPAFAAVVSMFTVIRNTVPQSAQRDSTVRREPGVFVRDSAGRMVPLHIRTLDVSVDIRGAMATTTFDITVTNPHSQVLEGEFSFPLTDGQTVARFALDIAGTLREGVVVTKTQGRVAYESTIRQRVDPALLEWTNDNAFRARIYPIPANGTRRIVIAYEQPLAGNADGYMYKLPCTFAQHIDTFRLQAIVAGFGLVPSMTAGTEDSIQLTPRGREYVLRVNETDIDLNTTFTLAVPVLAGRHYSAVSSHEGTSYAGIFLSTPQSVQPHSTTRISEITVVVDASLSGGKRDHDREHRFLDSLFSQLGSVTAHVVTFAHRPLTSHSFTVRNGNWSAVKQHLTSVVYDGGTQLGSVRFDMMRGDRIILFSDGISTFGAHRPIASHIPVICVTSGAQADHDVLRGIALHSGGRLVDLSSQSISDAVRAVHSQQALITEVNVLDGQVDEIRPQLPIEATNMTSLAAIVRSDRARVEIVTSLGGIPVDRDTIQLDQSMASGPAMAQLWAQFELQRLNMDRRQNAAAIAALGQRFTIVTPGTSLIVLERIEDYVRHHIESPRSEPALVAQYREEMTRLHADSAQRHSSHLDRVLYSLAASRMWYDGTYSTTPPAKPTRTTNDTSRTVRDFASVDTLRRSSLAHGLGDAIELAPGGSSVPFDADRAPNAVNQNAQHDEEPSVQEFSLSAEQQERVSDIGRESRFNVRGTRSAEHTAMVNGLYVSDVAAPPSQQHPGTGLPSSTSTENVRGHISMTPPSNRSQYLDELAMVTRAQIYSRYVELRDTHGTSTAFYIDVADLLRERGDTASALRVLSNLAELRGEDVPTLRILGYRLRQMGHSALAIMVLEDVLILREEEPQSYRDLALALVDAGRHQEACDMLYKLVTSPWDARFQGVETIALHELNRIIAKAPQGAISVANYDKRLIGDMPVGLRVVLSWDADNCDVDLWVTDPYGEKCYYSQPRTRIGGAMSHDMTGGYGPEQFMLRTPVKGVYKVQVHFFGTSQVNLAGPPTIMVELTMNEGLPTASQQTILTRVVGIQKVVDIGQFTVE